MAWAYNCVLDGWLVTIDGLIKLLPVPHKWLNSLEEMLFLVRTEDYQAGLAQKILDLHPRGDRRNCWGVDLGLLPEGSFDELFGVNGIIEQINQLKPSEEAAEEELCPPWSSGNIKIDYLADLTYYLNSFEQASLITKTLSIQEISDLLRRLSDHHKGIEKRKEEALKKYFWENKGDYDEDFYA